MVVEQHCQRTKCRRIVHLKVAALCYVNFTSITFSINAVHDNRLVPTAHVHAFFLLVVFENHHPEYSGSWVNFSWPVFSHIIFASIFVTVTLGTKSTCVSDR